MKNCKLLFIACLLPVAVIIHSCSRTEGGSAQFRMPLTGGFLPDEWDTEKNVRWTYDIEGRGWSSPVVSGNRVFITTAFNETSPPKPQEDIPPPQQQAAPRPPAAQPQAPGPQQGPPAMPREDTAYKSETYRWDVICLNLKTGREIWKKTAHRGSPLTGTNPGNGYASETPVTDGKRVYAYFGMTGVFCYDMNGKLIWTKDLGAFRTLNSWGTGSSPVLFSDILFIQADNEESSFLVALDAATGEEKWRVSRDEKTSYSTPFIWKNRVRTELVTGGLTYRSYDPLTGELLWEFEAGGRYSIPSASATEDLLYAGNAGGPDRPGILFAVKAGASGDISLTDSTATSSEWIAWSIPNAGIGNPSPLLHNGLLYMVSSRGGDITCIDALTGEIIYKDKIDKVAACWGSPWVYNDQVFFTDERGITYKFRAGKKFELLGQNRITDRFWTTPGIGSDAYVFKGVNKVYCVGR